MLLILRLMLLGIATAALASSIACVAPGGAAPEPGVNRSKTGAPPAATGDPASTIARNGALGLPSAASNADSDYLLAKTQYVESYNHGRGIPNWVVWHLERSDIGKAERSDWAPDPSIPQAWRILPNDYKRTGYTRGHLCPSGDRTATPEDNRATFLMTNMVPQTYDNNAGPWNELESECRRMVFQHKELYIAAGPVPPYSPIAGGRLQAPRALWKVVVVLPEGDNDLERVDNRTRVIAVIVPNVQGIKDQHWTEYVTTVDAIEAATGLDILSSVPAAVQSVIEQQMQSRSR